MARLPTVGSDNDNWGSLLNEFLRQALDSDGTLLISATNTYTGSTNTNLANSTRPGLVQLAGDLGVPYNAPKVVAIQGKAVAPTAPTDGQILTWNNSSSQWEPGTPGGGLSQARAMAISSMRM